MKETDKQVPIWNKYALSVPEAAEYFHIGRARIREMIQDDPDADFILENGTHVLIKRRIFEEYLDRRNVI